MGVIQVLQHSAAGSYCSEPVCTVSDCSTAEILPLPPTLCCLLPPPADWPLASVQEPPSLLMVGVSAYCSTHWGYPFHSSTSLHSLNTQASPSPLASFLQRRVMCFCAVISAWFSQMQQCTHSVKPQPSPPTVALNKSGHVSRSSLPRKAFPTRTAGA